MDPKLTALLKRKQALKAEGDKLIAKPQAERTEDDLARLDAILGARDPETRQRAGGELAEVEADIDDLQRLIAAETAEAHQRFIERDEEPNPDRARSSGQHDNAEDRPFASQGDFLQAVAAQGDRPVRTVSDPRLRPLAAATGMGGSTPADGGFLVPKEFSTELLRRGQMQSKLYSRVRRIPIGPNANGTSLPYVDETSRVTGSRYGGIQFYWGDEGSAPTATTPKLGRINLDLMRCSALCYVTEELLEDAVALEAFIGDAFATEWGDELDDKIINGDGAGRPLGILNAPGLVSVSKETGQAATTLVFENVSKAWARGMGNRFVWLHNRDVFPQLMQLQIPVGTGGTALFIGPGQADGSPSNNLLGIPLLEVDHCPTLGTQGDLILADLMKYVLIEKGGLAATSSMHVRFTQGEMTFRFRVRVNGQPIGSAAITPAKGSNTRSPFVAIANRS